MIRKIIFPAIVLAVTLYVTAAHAQYDMSSATALPLSVISNGSMSTAHDYYWWQVTLPSDGKVQIETNSSVGLEIDLSIYNANGVSLTGNDIGSGVQERSHIDNAGAGTYYIRARRWTGEGTYTIASTFTATSQENDTEKNDTVEAALTLSPNGSDTGHLGYMYIGVLGSDADDWWKVTTTFDGSLTVTTLSDSTVDVDLTLYDQDMTTYLSGNDIGTGPNERTHHYSLSPGTYYIKAHRWTGYGSYTITSVFESTGLANDSETGNTALEAVEISPDGSDTGHLGFHLNGEVDNDDWWKVTTLFDGALVVTSLSDSTLDVDLALYDQNMETYLSGNEIGTGPNERTHHYYLAQGTYYIKAHRWTGYGSYTITSAFDPTDLDNDAETGNAVANAIETLPSSADTGHLGFYLNGETDTMDWWKLTIPSDGSLVVTTLSDSTLDVDLSIHDVDMATYLSGNDIGTGPNERTHHYFLTPGTYYIKALKWTGYGSYTIETIFEPAEYANDTEPNDEFETASTLVSGTTATGHLGYYSIEATDIDDYYKISVPAGWDSLYVYSVSDSTLDIDISLYNLGGSSIASSGAEGVHEILKHDVLSTGTYYVRLHRWTGYGSYAVVAGSSYMEPVVSEPLPEIGSITGTVAHSTEGHLLAGAMITLSPGDYVSVTNEAGEFEFIDIPAGEYTATVTMESFIPTVISISLEIGGELEYALSLVPVEVSVETELPLVFNVSPPYPNPFNPATVISFTIPERSAVHIVIYDMLGRVVQVLAR